MRHTECSEHFLHPNPLLKIATSTLSNDPEHRFPLLHVYTSGHACRGWTVYSLLFAVHIKYYVMPLERITCVSKCMVEVCA